MSKTGYSRSPKLLKGAVIQFSAPMLIPIPNIIIFQYNPETMSRSFTPWAPLQRSVETSSDGSQLQRRSLDLQQIQALAQPFDPQETISLALELDATDALETPEVHPVAFLTGVADRLAALQMLLYPSEDSGPSLSISVGVSLGAGGLTGALSSKAAIAERKEVPIILFFFGPGLIVPVRLTSFSIEEQRSSPLLYPFARRSACRCACWTRTTWSTSPAAKGRRPTPRFWSWRKAAMSSPRRSARRSRSPISRTASSRFSGSSQSERSCPCSIRRAVTPRSRPTG